MAESHRLQSQRTLKMSLALCAAFGLFACGGGEKNRSKTQAPAEVAQAPVAGAASAPAGAGVPAAAMITPSPVETPTPPSELIAAWKPPADEPADLTEIKQRMLAGDSSSRLIKALQKLNYKYQKNPEVPFLLGQLYLGKLWVGDGLKLFHHAIELDPTLRENPFLIRAVINGLGNDRDAHQVQRFLKQEIGGPCAPYLEEVLQGEWRGQVKERAAAILRDLK